MAEYEFKNVMIMGAGGVGGYFGGRLAKRTSANVSFIARGPHLEAMQSSGLQINSVDGDTQLKGVNAFEDPSQAPTPDLVLFTVKSYDTAAAIQQIESVIDEHTQILTIQNGVENYPKLVKAFGKERVIQGFCKIGAGIEKPGVIRHKAFGEITVGEKSGETTPRLQVLQSLFDAAGVPLHITAKIDREVWIKFTWNCILNMLTAAGNVTVEKLFGDEQTEQLCYRLFDEIKEVAKAEGILLSPKDAENIIESARKLKGFTTSTYQDRQKGKRMEYEAFTGAIVRLAGIHELAVPHHHTLYAILKLIDQSN